eukprot:TRINITY_DN4766_c0_g1_i3.p1 TRINITY_DN4766_c0_g1~~TRINITY_DN4766_c0_g1_i3.p1  ORF type:complete len:313 (+),score=23.09 TRINITY_DN4766_c0_g1_i3:245-1183(+)
MLLSRSNIRCFRTPIRTFHHSKTLHESFCKQVTFIGGGKMAEAMLGSIVKKKLQKPDNIKVFDVNQERMKFCKDNYGTTVSSSVQEAVRDADFVVLSVKPQNVLTVYKELYGKLNKDAMLLSVVAGTPVKSLVSGFDIQSVVRTMPNTPAMIGQAMTVWTCTNSLDEKQREKAKKFISSFGEEVFVDNEDYLDMATALSGSGPAYIFFQMEAMIDAGVHMGFPRHIATKLVHQTMLGSCLYAMQSNKHVAELRNDITSPGGTTASAIYDLEKGSFRTVISDAVWAAYRRSLELGGKSSQVGPGRSSTTHVSK